MKKLIIRYALRWIAAPITQLQQTHPRWYWCIIAGVVSGYQVVNSPEVIDAITQACQCNASLVAKASSYLGIFIASILGQKHVDVKSIIGPDGKF